MSTSVIPQPTQAAMLGSTPSNSSLMQIKNNQDALMNLKKVGGKGKRGSKGKRGAKGKRGGAATGTVPIPIITAPYTSANGAGQDTTSQQQVMAKLALQSNANSEFDKLAVKNGGSRKSTAKKSRTKKSRSKKSRSKKSRTKKSRKSKKRR